MRHVSLDLVRERLPDDWDERAQVAAEAVACAPPENRAAAIDRYSAVWQEAKSALRQASHDKCWYCESVDIRSDNAIDHYRPKSAIAERAEHGGYWWLAFKWENYRFCCTFCNCHRIDRETALGGGKADHFPLRDEARRAAAPTDDLSGEEPLLLDPTVPADPGFLWFDDTGQAVPNPIACGKVGGYRHRRAAESVQLYHLNHTDIVERRKLIAAGVRRRASEADSYFQRYDAGDVTARKAFEDAVADLRGRLLEGAEYSAAAKAALMGLRGTHPVVDVILASV